MYDVLLCVLFDCSCYAVREGQTAVLERGGEKRGEDGKSQADRVHRVFWDIFHSNRTNQNVFVTCFVNKRCGVKSLPVPTMQS
jgi:hypothetical protein